MHSNMLILKIPTVNIVEIQSNFFNHPLESQKFIYQAFKHQSSQNLVNNLHSALVGYAFLLKITNPFLNCFIMLYLLTQ